MVVHNEVKQNAYYDSVTLMLISSAMGDVPGVVEAAAMMGTDHNKALMKNSGILSDEIAAGASANDLIIGISAESQEVIDAALLVLNERFESKNQSAADDTALRAKSLDGAFGKIPDLNFTVISLPGKYAKAEAMKCMKKGVHVLLFSDNVSIEEENELKDYAVDNNLLMMGPDCGTAIINGVALGFANVVRGGNIGVVAAAGTGLQEVTVIIDRLGGGISQALGTGGRDVKDAVGGKMMLLALDALEKDPETKVIGIVSKPPAKSVMQKVLEKVRGIEKPVVACFLGGDPALVDGTGALAARTLEDAAGFMVALARGETPVEAASPADAEAMAAEQAAKIEPGRRYLRGLFSGGTLSYEAMLILQDNCGGIYSNTALDPAFSLQDVENSCQHTIVDMGDDYFTDGMPHPMIDTRLRVERLKKEAMDPETAVILLDCVLGYGCNADPAGALADAIAQADQAAGGRKLAYVASVCGTDFDIQKRSAQEETLRKAGVIVMPNNAQASRMAAMIIEKLN